MSSAALPELPLTSSPRADAVPDSARSRGSGYGSRQSLKDTSLPDAPTSPLQREKRKASVAAPAGRPVASGSFRTQGSASGSRPPSRTGSLRGSPGSPGSFRGSPRGSAAGSPLGAARRLRSFASLPDISGESGLPPELEYAAMLGELDEETAARYFGRTPAEELSLSTDDVRRLFRARCIDQQLKPSQTQADREQRFLQYVTANCSGMAFRLKEAGLGAESTKCIASLLQRSSPYAVLDLSSNPIKDPGCEIVADLLETSDSLVHLSMRGCGLGAKGAEALGRVLETNATLTSLDLSAASQSRNYLGPRGGTALGGAMFRNRIVAVLNLDSTGLGDSGVTSLCEGARGHPALTELSLAGNDMSSTGVNAVAHMLGGTPLRLLSLDRNPIGDNGFAVIAGALCGDGAEGGPPPLKTLGLSQCKVKGKGLKHIAEALRAHPMPILTSLRLDGNSFGGSGEHLTEALRDNTRLQTLGLSKCDFNKTDFQSIAAGLAGQKHLQRVDLSDNEAEDEGVAALAGAVGHADTGIRILELARCRISDGGGAALADMLRANTSLVTLQLRQNAIRTSGCKLAEAITKHTCLLQLCLDGNPIDFQDNTAVEAALKKNSAHNQKSLVPRLNRKIHALQGDVVELTSTREEISVARTRAAQDQTMLQDRKEHAKRSLQAFKDRERSASREYEQVHSRLLSEQTEVDEAHDAALARFEEHCAAKRQKLQNKLLYEQGGNKRVQAELRQVGKLLATLQESWGEIMSPLYAELADAEESRGAAEEEATKLAGRLAEMELRVKQLETLQAAGDTSSDAGARPALRSEKSGLKRKQSSKRGSMSPDSPKGRRRSQSPTS